MVDGPARRMRSTVRYRWRALILFSLKRRIVRRRSSLLNKCAAPGLKGAALIWVNRYSINQAVLASLIFDSPLLSVLNLRRHPFALRPERVFCERLGRDSKGDY
jgi:hypothetical protein